MLAKICCAFSDNIGPIIGMFFSRTCRTRRNSAASSSGKVESLMCFCWFAVVAFPLKVEYQARSYVSEPIVPEIVDLAMPTFAEISL